jgi:hypothetical protein
MSDTAARRAAVSLSTTTSRESRSMRIPVKIVYSVLSVVVTSMQSHTHARTQSRSEQCPPEQGVSRSDVEPVGYRKGKVTYCFSTYHLAAG